MTIDRRARAFSHGRTPVATHMRRWSALLVIYVACLCRTACVDGQEDAFAIVSPDWGTAVPVGDIVLHLQLPCCWASISPALSIEIVVAQHHTDGVQWSTQPSKEWRAGASRDCDVMRSMSSIRFTSPGGQGGCLHVACGHDQQHQFGRRVACGRQRAAVCRAL